MTLLLVGESLTYNIEKLWHLIQVIKKSIRTTLTQTLNLLTQSLPQLRAKPTVYFGYADFKVLQLVGVAVYGQYQPESTVLLLKHGAQAETGMEHVRVTDVIDTKAHKVATTPLGQLVQRQDVSILFALAEYFHVVVLNVKAVKAV